MAQQTPAQRIRRRYSSRMWMYLIVLVGYYAIASGFLWNIGDGDIDRLKGFADNVLTEVGGAAVTFFIFELILERRDQERDMLRALRQMRSISNDTAIGAVGELREEGILSDGSLQQADLWRANLKGADLQDTDLRGANLASASLQEANLSFVNLQDSNLGGANLRDASFRFADLQGASMVEAELEGAQLRGVNLQGATLVNANFNTKTTLPNDNPFGKRSFWTPDTDMKRFTDPNHPDFWRSDDPNSPAYRG